MLRIWALRRSDSLSDLGITHVLSLVDFNHSTLKNFKDEPWTEYGKAFRHLVIDVDDVDDTDLLVEMPRAVRFIDEALQDRGDSDGAGSQEQGRAVSQHRADKSKLGGGGAVFVHCAAGKSRSVAVSVAYLLWRHPGRFDPNCVPPASSDLSARDGAPLPSSESRRPRETAPEAVGAALELIRRTRPMAEPNNGFMEQLALWWEMGCPEDVETHPVYQRWAYKREVEENVAVGQAPSRLRFEDEQQERARDNHGPAPGFNLRCKKCRRTLATAPFIQAHSPAKPTAEQPCPHHFIEPLSWMRGELERSQLSGRLVCPNERCGAGVGRYDWKGIRCACGAWVTPGLSLQRAKVDEEVVAPVAAGVDGRTRMGIRMPPGRGGHL